MSYLSLDEECVHKVEKYTNKIEEAYKKIRSLTSAQINDGLYGYALAQCLTNLYETVIRANNDELAQKLLPLLQRTKTTRNIASHDYDSLNWDIVKNNCRAILDIATPEFLRECQAICERDKHGETDYTSGDDGELDFIDGFPKKS